MATSRFQDDPPDSRFRPTPAAEDTGPCCAQLIVRSFEAWCPDHGTRSTSLLGRQAVEERRPVRRHDLAANNGRTWSTEEEDWLMENKDSLSVADLAQALARSPAGIMKKLCRTHVPKRRVCAVRESRATDGRHANPARHRRWSRAEDNLLLDLPVEELRKKCERLLPGRTWRSAVERRRRIIQDEAPVRESDGLLTLTAVSRYYRCPLARVRRLVETGVLKATRAAWGDWRIDPADCERPEVRARLNAPKRTWRDGAAALSGRHGNKVSRSVAS